MLMLSEEESACAADSGRGNALAAFRSPKVHSTDQRQRLRTFLRDVVEGNNPFAALVQGHGVNRAGDGIVQGDTPRR